MDIYIYKYIIFADFAAKMYKYSRVNMFISSDIIYF